MDARSRRNRALYFALCASITAFSLVFLYTTLAPVPIPRYYPFERAWALEAQPHDALAMNFYGMCLLAAGTALVAAAAVFGAYRPRKRLGENEHALWAGWAGISLLLAVALISFQLVRREPGPILEPGGPPQGSGNAPPARGRI